MKFNTLCLIIEGQTSLRDMPVHLKPVIDFINYARSVAKDGTAPFRRDELEDRAAKMMSDIAGKLTKPERLSLEKHVFDIVDLLSHGYGDTIFGYDAGSGESGVEVSSGRMKTSQGFTTGKTRSEPDRIDNMTPGW